MAWTIWDFETNMNAVIVNYSQLGSRGPSWQGDKPVRMVVQYHGYMISASIYYKGFWVYKNAFSPSKHFQTLKEAKRYIIKRVNKERNLFKDET